MKTAIERDLNDLFIFTKVVEHQSFSGAARALSMQTSSVSRRVSRLEDALGARLLERTTRKLSLTEDGEVYFESATRILAELEAAEAQISENQATLRGRIRVVAPTEHGITMVLVNEFLREHPDVRVDLEVTGRSVNILEEGFDVSIQAGELPSLSVVAHKISESAFAMVATPDYLARRGRPQEHQDLAAHDCIVVGAAAGQGHWLLPSANGNAKGNKRVAVSGRVSVNHLHAVRDAAVFGHGIALLPLLICGEDIRRGRLERVMEEFTPPPVPIYVTCPAGRLVRPAVRAFVAHVRLRFPEVAKDW